MRLKWQNWQRNSSRQGKELYRIEEEMELTRVDFDKVMILQEAQVNREKFRGSVDKSSQVIIDIKNL